MLLEYRKPGCVAGYCDNQSRLWNTKIQGIPVWQPEKAKIAYPDAIYLITSRKYAEEIEKQLHQLEASEKQILVYTAGIDLLLFQKKME